MSEVFGYEKLDVWVKAMDLVDAIYRDSSTFPKHEIYGLTGQLRRAAISIPSNIAEGYGRGEKAFANHLRIAQGSTYELRTQIEIARRQAFLEQPAATSLAERAVQVSRMIDGLIRSMASDR